ncbi:hypothetical protein SLE2022_312140 [Rubroshorea leprosula]
MAAKFEACVECTQKCLLFHEKKKNSSSIITSFFKVIIASHCLSYLYLPPKFAATVSELIDQETILEDSNGCQRKIKISKLNGSLAFDLNWDLFSVDHGLKVGDFLVFHYIKGAHFLVKIYDKTGCEKLDFPYRRNRLKRARVDGHYNTKVGPCNSVGKGLVKNYSLIVPESDVGLNWGQLEMNDMQKVHMVRECASNFGIGSEEPVPAFGEKFAEEPLCLTNRVLGATNGEDRRSILDLASFEKPKIDNSFDRSNKVIMGDRGHDDADVYLRCGSKSFLVGCDLLAKETVSRTLPSDASIFEDIEQINDPRPMHKIETIFDKGSCNNKVSRQLLIESVEKPDNGGCMSDMSTALMRGCWDAEKREQAQSGFEADIIKGESVKNNPVEVLKQMHTSLVDDCQVAQLKFAGTSETSALPITSGIQQWQKQVFCEENSYPNIIVSDNNQVGGILTVEQTVNGMLPSDASDFVKMKQINDAKLMHKTEIVSDKGSSSSSISGRPLNESAEKPDKGSHMSIGLSEGCWNVEKTDKVKSERAGNTGKGEAIENDPVAILQQKQISLIDECQIPQVKFDGIGTVEAVHSISTTPIAANISCLMGGDSQSFLELPTYLPTCLPPSPSKRTRIIRKVVLLRDPDMRPWPVLYHERSRFGILCSGWEAFSKANGIQVGDECVFCAERESEGIYRVYIIRNQMKAHVLPSLIL